MEEEFKRTYWGRYYTNGLIPFHAGSISDGKKAILFPGISGAGKTTSVKYLRDMGLLSLGDETVFLKIKNGKPVLYSSVSVHPPITHVATQVDIPKAELVAIIGLKADDKKEINKARLIDLDLEMVLPPEVLKIYDLWLYVVETLTIINKLPIYLARRPYLDELYKLVKEILSSGNMQ